MSEMKCSSLSSTSREMAWDGMNGIDGGVSSTSHCIILRISTWGDGRGVWGREVLLFFLHCPWLYWFLLTPSKAMKYSRSRLNFIVEAKLKSFAGGFDHQSQPGGTINSVLIAESTTKASRSLAAELKIVCRLLVLSQRRLRVWGCGVDIFGSTEWWIAGLLLVRRTSWYGWNMAESRVVCSCDSGGFGERRLEFCFVLCERVL